MNEQQRKALDALDALYGDAIDGGFQPSEHAFEKRKVLKEYILNSTPVPEGWQLVPVEPTREMMIASEGWHEYDVPDHWVNCNEVRRVYGSYRAMLAAAPTREEL